MREIEHGGAAVSAVGEQEAARAAAGRSRAFAQTRPGFSAGARSDTTSETPARPACRGGSAVSGVSAGYVGMHAVAEARRQLEAEAVAPGPRQRQPAGRENDRARPQRRVARDRHPPSSRDRRRSPRRRGLGCQPADLRAEPGLDAPPRCQLEQTVADLARAIRRGKELPGLRLGRQRDAGVALQELPLLRERPREQHAAQQVRRGVGHEPLGLRGGGQHVAAPAAADQDLAAAVARALEQHRPRLPPPADAIAATMPAAPAPTTTMGRASDTPYDMIMDALMTTF